MVPARRFTTLLYHQYDHRMVVLVRRVIGATATRMPQADAGTCMHGCLILQDKVGLCLGRCSGPSTKD